MGGGVCWDSGECERYLKHSKNFAGCDPCIQTLIRGYAEKYRVEGNKDPLWWMESGRQAHLCGRGQQKCRLLLTSQRENRSTPTLLSACLKGKNTPPIHFPIVPSSARNGCYSWWTRLHNQNRGKARGHPRLHSNQETLLQRFKEYQREENKFPPGLCCLTAGSNQREDGSGDGV